MDILFIHFSNFGRSIICFLQKVDFCCGANDFSLLMKEKQEETQKSCLFKYYDIIQPKVIVFFFRKFFHFVQLFLFKPIVCCMLPMKTSFCFFFSLFAAWIEVELSNYSLLSNGLHHLGLGGWWRWGWYKVGLNTSSLCLDLGWWSVPIAINKYLVEYNCKFVFSMMDLLYD